MFDINIRLVTMLGILTILVVAGLVLDYFRLIRRPARLGLGLAVVGIAAGVLLTVQAVLPDNHFYGPVLSKVPTTQQVVALTFDDGPYPPYTNQILDVLQENHVQATFFVLGKNAADHPDLVKRIVGEGHQIGNHSYDHMDLLKADRAAIEREVDRTGSIIRDITGEAPHVVRPPHGFRDPVVMEVMQQRGLRVVEWSVVSRDWTNPGVDVIVNRTLANVRNGSIILLHDGDGVSSQASRQQTVEAVRLLIHSLSAQGYRFVTVDEILKDSGN